ncbi:ribosome maturation factor RimP [Aureimonas frigidaquae]|uniref:ribosome maturation factor RimP n=1 Tax=Aureimonas frigidaquae TaxID=424757 RepID=UPI0009FA6169|nr:ribosome maturation factor RimP [Aureimonas frigidaquae]
MAPGLSGQRTISRRAGSRPAQTTGDFVSEDTRIIREEGLEARVADIVEPVIGQLGYRLVRVRYSGMNGATLQIMAERPDGTMAVEDCEAVSRAISPVLDVEDPLDKAYHLEVSSPGIDRPLVRRSDFESWAGHLMKLETSRLIGARKRFRGRVVEVMADGIRIDRDQPAYGEDATVEIPFDAIGEARLILTDDLIEASLKADKMARKGRAGPDAQDGADDGDAAA